MTEPVKVYFATNRVHDPTQPPKDQFTGRIVDPTDAGQISYAVVLVSGIDLGTEDSGTIDQITDLATGGFSDAVRNALVNSAKNLLIFIHGFDNSFDAAIRRAAFNREWFAAAGLPAADTTVIAFTWPSQGTFFAAPGHTPPVTYLSDQVNAGKSGHHLACFFKQMEEIAAAFRSATGGKVFLLAHSMGNYALQAGVQAWFDENDPPEIIFDEVILAAADERADSFEFPNGGRLSKLPRLTKRISVYHSVVDVAMTLSMAVNLDKRLGFEGPDDQTDERLYPPTSFRTVDCASLDDYDRFEPVDASHQYYRRSPTVRTDIATLMAAGPVKPGISELRDADS